jgi:hypothetical protein
LSRGERAFFQFGKTARLKKLAEFAAAAADNSESFFHVPREKTLTRSGRRRRLHIVRFGPSGQSSLISLLLLFKTEAVLPF